MATIKTTESRITILRGILASVGMTVILGGGIVAEDRFYADIQLHSGKYTGYEYRQLKIELGNEVAAKSDGDEYDINRYFDWVKALDIEYKKCDKRAYPAGNSGEARGLLKRYNDEGCPASSILVR